MNSFDKFIRNFDFKRTSQKKYKAVVYLPRNGELFNDSVYNQVVRAETPYNIILGLTRERYIPISLSDLIDNFCMEDGTRFQNMYDAVKHFDNHNFLRVMNINQEPCWAAHINLNHTCTFTDFEGKVQGVNIPGIYHNRGDFVCCKDAGGEPDYKHFWLVNGADFPLTYNMKTFPNFKYGSVKASKKRFIGR